MSILTVKNITKQYQNELVLNDINFDIKLGEIIALVGKNGAGKTTLMKIITSISSTINFIMFSIVTIFTIIIVSSLFGNSGMCLNKDSFSVVKFIYHQFTLLLLIITLSIQAICIQKIVENQF